MEDILITDIQEFEEITDSVILDKEVPVSVSDDNLRKEIIEGGEPINKSDVSILGSNDINSMLSAKAISIEDDFEQFILWENSNPYSSFSDNSILLSSSLSDFDIIQIGFTFNVNEFVTNSRNVYIIASDFPKFNDQSFANVIQLSSSNVYRGFLYVDNTHIRFLNAVNSNGVTVNTACIPVYVKGLNLKEGEIIQPDIPVNPSVSGNVVNNYYISLSGNGVSYNLIDKPLNEYTPTESMFALSILFALGIGFVILCRKAVFRWK